MGNGEKLGSSQADPGEVRRPNELLLSFPQSVGHPAYGTCSSSSDSEEEWESFLGLGWGQVEWAVLLLGIGTTVAAISWMVR